MSIKTLPYMKMKVARLVIASRKLLTIIFLAACSASITAQVNDCSFYYYNAMNLYSTGNIDSAYAITRYCIRDARLFSKTPSKTKADIYRLNALSSILLDKPDDARASIKKLLSFQPYYKDNFRQGDLLEFKQVVNSFSVQPELLAGVNCFTGYSGISLKKVLTEEDNAVSRNISVRSEYGAGLFIEHAFTKNISAGVGASLYRFNVSYTGSDIPFSTGNSYNMQFQYLETPVYASYKFMPDRKLKPYIRAGLTGRFYIKSASPDAPDMLRSTEYGTYYMKENQAEGEAGVLSLFFRNFENIDLSVGGGVAYSFRNSSFDMNVGLQPFSFNTKPLDGINEYADLPHDEWFSLANETIVVDVRRIVRISLAYKYFIKYKAF